MQLLTLQQMAEKSGLSHEQIRQYAKPKARRQPVIQTSVPGRWIFKASELKKLQRYRENYWRKHG